MNEATFRMKENDFSDGEIYYVDFISGKAVKQTDGTEISFSYELHNTDRKFTIRGKDVAFTDHAFYKGFYMILTEATPEEIVAVIPCGTTILN